MTTATDERPGVDEKYVSASHTSNLRVEADRTGSADVIIAAGWSPTRVGMALLRLASEWDGAEKHTGMSETDFVLLRAKLKSLSSVLEQITLKMQQMAIESAPDKAGPIVGYWLHPNCWACSGLKFRRIQGAPALSSRTCTVCRGEGVSRWPHQQEGKRVLAFMDDSVSRARQSIKLRLRNY